MTDPVSFEFAPLDIDAEHGAGLGPQNVERTASRAKTVLSYGPDARMDTLQRGGVAADADLKHAGPYQRTPAVFQGDLAPQRPKLLGAIDFAHAALSDQFDDAIRAHDLPFGEERGLAGE